MGAEFELALSEEERQYLLSAAIHRIDLVLREQKIDFLPPPESAVLHEKLGVFASLKLYGSLRGCIGRLVSNDPLYITIADIAEAAAFHDSRFPPLTIGEFAEIGVEISILGPITLCPDPERIVLGKHGLIVRRGQRQGLLLPQVAVEWEWDRETFLSQACRKAGLAPEVWQDSETEIYWFEACVVG